MSCPLVCGSQRPSWWRKTNSKTHWKSKSKYTEGGRFEDPPHQQSSQSWPGIVRREGGRVGSLVQMKLEIRGEERRVVSGTFPPVVKSESHRVDYKSKYLQLPIPYHGLPPPSHSSSEWYWMWCFNVVSNIPKPKHLLNLEFLLFLPSSIINTEYWTAVKLDLAEIENILFSLKHLLYKYKLIFSFYRKIRNYFQKIVRKSQHYLSFWKYLLNFQSVYIWQVDIGNTILNSNLDKNYMIF